MAKPPSDQAEKIVVRLPDGMRNKLTEKAKTNNRSVNSEVVIALENWINPHRKYLMLALDMSNLLDTMGIMMEHNPGLRFSFEYQKGERLLRIDSSCEEEDRFRIQRNYPPKIEEPQK